MTGLPSMVIVAVAVALLAANSLAFPAPVAPASGPSAPSAPGGVRPLAPGAGLRPAADTPQDTKDLEGSETYGFGYGLGYGWGTPWVSTSYWGYPRHYYRSPYYNKYYYGYPYYSGYWDDWNSYYYW